MKRNTGYILMILLMALQAVGFSSCIMDHYDEDQEPGEVTNDNMWVRVRVSTLDDATPLTPERELIHSLRIILVNAEGEVEYNYKKSFDNPVSSYEFNVLTTAGNKNFYFIANEENINCLNADETTTPLSTILSGYLPGLENATSFEDKVKNLYFDRTYFENDNNYIPLSSQYNVTLLPGDHKDENLEFYLVRTATKYTVHFENSRTESLEIKDLYIQQLESQMYLMPHVGEKQQTISGMPWIDWLRMVSDESNEPEANQGDVNFNTKYGWITDYQVPSNKPFNFYLINNGSETIPGKQTESGGTPVPGTIPDLGPFYSTEGFNLIPGDATGAQQYTLFINLHDNGENKDIRDSRILPNLGALFRNTHVIINVTFDESWMHVYAQIESWKEDEAYGSVTEEK